MKGMASGYFVLWLTLFFVIIELITFFGILYLFENKRSKIKFSIVFHFIAVLVFIIWFLSYGQIELIKHTKNYDFFYFSSTLLTVNYLPKTLFSLFVIIALFLRIFKFKCKIPVLIYSGLILSTGCFLSIISGVFIGRQNVITEEITISIPSLPVDLEGLKIVQISDAHLASLKNNDLIAKCVRKVDEINPDLFFFTGDIVNNYYQEIQGFDEQFSSFKAKYGKFAILGNHDYGNYVDWLSREMKLQNNDKIMEMLTEAGFYLLRNDADKIQIGNTAFYVIGTEDWGHGTYNNYSELDKAIKNIDNDLFRILLAHNPKQWPIQVVPDTDIQLTLSGHTHGGQAGFKIAGIRFSLMRLIEKNWGGLYEKDGQYLYVNRGLGCIGNLMRIDMEPEITVITLTRR